MSNGDGENTTNSTSTTVNYVSGLLGSLDQIKVYHWQTKCYARHKATDDLHKKLSKLVDDFVETMYGCPTLDRPMLSEDGDEDLIELSNWTDDDAVEGLGSLANWFNSDEFCGPITDRPDLMHLRDEMLAAVNRALYLFTFD